MKFLFFLFLSNFLFSQNFIENSTLKLKILKKELIQLNEPNYFENEHLVSVILPEYLTFETEQNEIEVAYVKMLYKIGNNDYKKISIGPFQMQLKFIYENIIMCNNSSLDCTLFQDCKKKGFMSLIKNINDYSTLYYQWKILKLFEYNLTKKGNISIDDMRLFYNSGSLKKNNTVFSKIKYKNMSYNDWCSYLFGIYTKIKV